MQAHFICPRYPWLWKASCHAFTPSMYIHCNSSLIPMHWQSIKDVYIHVLYYSTYVPQYTGIKSPPPNPMNKDIVFSSMFNIINKYKKKINSKENNSLVHVWSCLFVSHREVHEIAQAPCLFKAEQLVMGTDHSEGESLSCPSDPLDHCPWAEKHKGLILKHIGISFKHTNTSLKYIITFI